MINNLNILNRMKSSGGEPRFTGKSSSRGGLKWVKGREKLKDGKKVLI